MRLNPLPIKWKAKAFDKQSNLDMLVRMKMFVCAFLSVFTNLYAVSVNCGHFVSARKHPVQRTFIFLTR